MSDLFHEAVPTVYIERVVKIMLGANWHTFQVLTKRAERMSQLLQNLFHDAAKAQHIWWGVSMENRKHGLPRIDHLRRAQPAVGWISVEPLLEHLGGINLTGIHWVVAGGESGPRARPAHPNWFRSLRNQCEEVAVPFFFKQWGEWMPEDLSQFIGTTHSPLYHWDSYGDYSVRVGKKLAGRLLDGVEYNEFPEVAK